MKRSTGIYVVWAMVAVLIDGCSGGGAGSKPVGVTLGGQRLAGCPDRPNCVSSEARDIKQLIAPFLLKGDPAAGWEAIRGAVSRLPRHTVVQSTDRYLHVACKSRLFGFIDDLELQLDFQTGLIAIRSAARVGYSDFGVNRRRVETLRQTLKKDGIIL